MKGKLFTAAALALLAAAPASAQTGQENLRRFTTEPMDTNRSNRIVYVPLGWSFPGSRPANPPYDVAVASWYRQPVGIRGVRADNTLDRAEYVLESFEALPGRARTQFRVVINRRNGGAVADEPELHLVHVPSQITTMAEPRIERAGGGTRYTFVVSPPRLGTAVGNDRYELRLMSARDVKLPPAVARKPTFDGIDVEERWTIGPPRLPYAERVAGKRLEYRAGGNVVVDTRVAGSRQEIRSRK